MKRAILVMCCVVGLALAVGAQTPMPGHAERRGDGAAGVAARIRQIEGGDREVSFESGTAVVLLV